MSTKIYNGYLFHADPFVALPIIRETFKATQLEEASRLMTTSVVLNFDLKTVGKPYRGMVDIVNAWHCPLWDTKRIHSFNIWTWKDYTDAMLSPSIKFSRHPSGQYAAQLWDVERNVFRGTWEAFDFVEPYPYWNNSDPEDGVTEEEWGERKVFWSETLGWESGARTPSEVGLEFAPVNTIVWMNATISDIHVPSMDSRQKEISRFFRADEIAKKHGNDTSAIMSEIFMMKPEVPENLFPLMETPVAEMRLSLM